MSTTITRRAALVLATGLLAGGAATATTASAAPTHHATTTATVVAGKGDLRMGARGDHVRALQAHFNQLGYSVGPVDGIYGPRMRQAVLAIQKVNGLPRTGVYDARTSVKGSEGRVPTPRSRKGHVIEIDKKRQILMVVDNGRVSRIYNVSTGSGKRYYDHGWKRAVTPSGTYRFWTQYRGGKGWQHGRLGSMYRPMYFNGGIAIHGSKYDIGAYPSSHGCVRIYNANMDELRTMRAIYLGGTVMVY